MATQLVLGPRRKPNRRVIRWRSAVLIYGENLMRVPEKEIKCVLGGENTCQHVGQLCLLKQRSKPRRHTRKLDCVSGDTCPPPSGDTCSRAHRLQRHAHHRPPRHQEPKVNAWLAPARVNCAYVCVSGAPKPARMSASKGRPIPSADSPRRTQSAARPLNVPMLLPVDGKVLKRRQNTCCE